MRGKVIYSLFIFIALHACVLAQPVISYNGDLNMIGIKSEFLVDSSSTMTLDEVTRSDKFIPSTNVVPNFQITPYTYWVRLRIKNEISKDKLSLQIAHTLIDSISFYEFLNGSLVLENHSGGMYPFDSRAVKQHQTYIYPIHTSLASDTVICYVRLKSGAQLMLPAYLGTESEVFSNVLKKDILFGIYLGIMLVMILYNTFIYVTVKDKHYLYYIIYLLIVLLTQASLEGYIFRFIIPNNPYLATLNIYIASSLVGIAAIEFSKSFLLSKELAPRFHKFSYVFWVVYGATIVLPFLGKFNASYQLILMAASVSSIFVLTMAVRILMKGSRYARYFLIAWSVFIACVVIYVLKDFGILPYNFITTSSLQFGSAFEAVMLSFALADKINQFKKEKEISQAETMEALEENARIIKEQNVMLEAKVDERTQELQASNNDLNKAMRELKEAEAQLVESEKMASLGQLTAGIAHEINNPINFVTSNVKPLKRDVDMVIDMLNQFEGISLSGDSLEDKKKRIDDLKQEYDFDYLKTEIDYLLKGINEGSSRTAEIVKGLRIFSRLDEDDLKKANINEGIDSTIIIINNLLGNVEIKKEYGNIPMVECYPGKLNQVFLNIITNGIHAVKDKFKDEKGGAIIIKTTADENMVYVSIKDNGIGMDDNTKKKLFEPFFTTKDVGEGTGLGLSIAWNTIQKHNGNIVVNSELGNGTDFILEIPIIHK